METDHTGAPHPTVAAAEALADAADSYVRTARADPPPAADRQRLRDAEERVRIAVDVADVERLAGAVQTQLVAEDERALGAAVDDALGD